jgi:dienelactone hydrolase
MPLPTFKVDPATGSITAGHGFEGAMVKGRLTGNLQVPVLHGAPTVIDLAPSATAQAAADVIETPVEFMSRGLRLRGTLVRPTASGPYPALVSLHGSGPSTRWFALARARHFARAGYAMLIFDKPGNGESEGDWTMTSLDEMAADAIAAVDFLRAQPGIDPRRVGLWGHSQAGQVISRAVPKTDHISFAIVLAGGGITPREIEEYYYANQLRRGGASTAVSSQAMDWVRRYFAYEASGRGYDALVADLEAHPLMKQALGVSTVYPMPEQQPKWAWVATYQPMDDISRIHIPMLLLFAEKDQETPGKLSLARWREGLKKAGNRKVEGKLFAGADHHFFVASPTGGWPSMAPGYYDYQIDWLNRFFRK